MNKRLREIERESGLEIFGLGAKRHIWEAALEKYAELIVQDCIEINKQELAFNAFEQLMSKYQEHFGVEETRSQKMKDAGFTRRPKGWTKDKE